MPMPVPKFIRLNLHDGIYAEEARPVFLNPEHIIEFSLHPEGMVGVTVMGGDIYYVTEDVETIKIRIEGVYT